MYDARRHPAALLRALLAALALTLTVVAAGQLDPPAPPAPTMKTLAQVEPRIPIDPDQVPLLIDSPGSYYLTGDLDCSALVDQHCVEISADYVALDLSGYTVYGPSGNGMAIVMNPPHSHGTVRDGFVRGGSTGVFLSSYGRAEDLQVRNASYRGIESNSYAVAERCIVVGSGDHGIALGSVGTVIDSIAHNNGGDGIVVSSRGQIFDSMAAFNDGSGIHAGAWGRVEGNRIRSNKSSGIVVSAGSTIRDNHVVRNTGNGINVYGAGSHVEGNTLVENRLAIRVADAGNLIIRNYLSGNSLSIDPGNDVGPVGSAASSTSPWANIEY